MNIVGSAAITARSTLMLACVLGALAMPVRAEPGPIGRWLMNTPLTLWDWGMMRADQAAEKAALQTQRFVVGDGEWSSSAWYSWENNEIEIVVDVASLTADMSHEGCNEARRSFIGVLSGAWNLRDEQLARQRMSETIGRWFSHEGFQRENRDEDLAEKLTRIVFVKVRLWGDYAEVGIECRARSTTFYAPSMPSS